MVVSRHPQKGLSAYLRCFTGLVPSGLTPSSVLKCGLINHRDGEMTYVPRGVTTVFRARGAAIPLPRLLAPFGFGNRRERDQADLALKMIHRSDQGAVQLQPDFLLGFDTAPVQLAAFAFK